MKSYKIQAKALNGAAVEEIIAAESQLDANRIASEKGLFVTSIKEVQAKGAGAKKLGAKDLIMFSQLMGALLHAGIPMDRAIDLARDKSPNPKAQEVYAQIYEQVQKGDSFSQAMADTGAFPPLYVNMVESGAISGDLSSIFATMGEYYEKEAALNQKIKSAMVYPIVLAVVVVIVVIILTVFVLPGIMETFEGMELPPLTKGVMAISDFITTKWYILIGMIGAGIFALKQAFKKKEFRVKFGKFKLQLPVIGKLLTTIYSARAARSISSLYQNGVKIPTIVKETGGTIGNDYIESLFEEIYIEVTIGTPLSRAIDEANVFDPMLSSMLEVGEQSGDLTDVLESTANFFNDEAEAATERLVGLLEPLFLLIMGVVIGLIVVAIMQPMMSMYDMVG